MSAAFDPNFGLDRQRPPTLERFSRVLTALGLWVMGFGGMLISTGFVLCGIYGALHHAVDLSARSVIMIPACIIGVLASAWHVVVTILALMRPRLPAPIQVALMQPRWPFGARWIVAVWWLLHLSVGAILAISVLHERPPSWQILVLLTVLSMVFTYAAHGFLMLVVTCFTRHSDWIIRVWRWRHLSSIGHGLVVFLAGIM